MQRFQFWAPTKTPATLHRSTGKGRLSVSWRVIRLMSSGSGCRRHGSGKKKRLQFLRRSTKSLPIRVTYCQDKPGTVIGNTQCTGDQQVLRMDAGATGVRCRYPHRLYRMQCRTYCTLLPPRTPLEPPLIWSPRAGNDKRSETRMLVLYGRTRTTLTLGLPRSQARLYARGQQQLTSSIAWV